MTCQWPLWPRRPRIRAIYCLAASTPTKTPTAPIVKRRDIITKAVLNSRKRKKWRRKMAKNHSVQITHHVTHAGKRTIQLKDVGNALALTCVPRGHRKSKKMQMLQLRKANLKQPVTRRLLVQANPIPKRLIQRTNFATTPNI